MHILKRSMCFSGPTALVQFRVWSIGDLDMTLLTEKLRSVLRNAICDVLMEYYLLTAPICEIPKHLLDLVPLPSTVSAPSSPFFTPPGNSVVKLL